MFWTDEKVETMRRMLNEGYSYSIVAAQIGCSRNAAIGKAKRIGIEIHARRRITKHTGPQVKTSVKVVEKPRDYDANPMRPNRGFIPKPLKNAGVPFKPKSKLTKRRVRLPLDLKSDEAFELYMNTPKASRMVDITNIPGAFECKWITGDVKEGYARWCCCPTVENSPWCDEHIKIVYAPPSVYKRAPKRAKDRS